MIQRSQLVKIRIEHNQQIDSPGDYQNKLQHQLTSS